jgi:hypothetical protein
VGDLNSFERFLGLAEARTAQVLNLSDLADYPAPSFLSISDRRSPRRP